MAYRSRRSIAEPPGTLHSERQSAALIDEMQYNPAGSSWTEGISGADFQPGAPMPEVIRWINVVGVNDVSLLRRMAEVYGLDTLLLEDVQKAASRPKIDDYRTYAFLTLRMLRVEEEHIESEQLSVVWMPGLVITFQERPGDLFEGIRERILTGTGRIRAMGADYLVYALVDAIVDHYLLVGDFLQQELEEIETDVLGGEDRHIPVAMREVRGELIRARRALAPLREVVGHILKGEVSQCAQAVLPFYRDVYDHIHENMDTLETLREMSADVSNSFQTQLASSLNEVTKVLTIIATIFIPLTFLAGIYGMNFQHMPELGWRWSYPVVVGVMLIIGLAMVRAFRKRRWL